MLLTLKLVPEVTARLQVIADQLDASLEGAAARVLAVGVLSELEVEAILHAMDAEEARRILASTSIGAHIPLSRLEAELGAE